ncbi:MAG: cysteine desulfurase family protein [Candidatus Zixiibacteriota bacterium]|jgi:cysteine desulfurase
MDGIYLDYNATTPTAPEVFEAMAPFFSDNFANPSNLHAFGLRANKPVTAARRKVAELLGAASPEEIVFTGGGSEADNLAVKGVAFARRDAGRHVVTSAVEHPAVLVTCEWLASEGYDVSFLAPDERGVISPETLAAVLRDDTILASIMHTNNEVGTVEPIAELAAVARERGVLFHTDAVQSVGKVPVNVKDLGVDLLSISAHKFYGPKGVGVLYVREGVDLVPVILGGHQEEGRRAGTHNTPGIVGLARALELAVENLSTEGPRLAALRDELRDGVMAMAGSVVIMTPERGVVPNTLNVCFPGIDGESLMLALDMEGVSAATGSACASGSDEPSHVLTAMGCRPEIARGSIRFSLGKYTRPEDVRRVLEVLPAVVEKLRAVSPAFD